MGTTIHFEGQLHSNLAFSLLMDRAAEYAAEYRLQFYPFQDKNSSLLRIRNDRMFEYRGRTKGIIIDPGANGEVMVLEFDETLFAQQSCKTQYGGIEAHLNVVNLLRLLHPCFNYLNVLDETGFWETKDEEKLRMVFEKERARTKKMMMKYGEK